MDTPFPGDGQASSYTNALSGHGQQSPCVPELTGMESYYALSSGPQDEPPHLSSTGPLPVGSTLSQPQENHHKSHPAHNMTTYTSMTSGFQYPPRNHDQVWPSPPPGPEDYDNYSYQSSPSSGSGPMSCYNPSPISPRTWSSPDFPHALPSDLIQQQSQPNSFKNLRVCTPTSNEGYPVRGPRVLTPFTGAGMSQGFNDEIDGLPHSCSPATVPSSSTGALSCNSSPQEPLLGTPVHMETRQESPAGEPEYRVSPEVKLEATASAKNEEPYAKLLYRALMSVPDHAMTLQEIYQWFRENTDKDIKKDKSEKRPGKNAEGWQNSIRHNLSMNEAFVKRETKRVPDSASKTTDQGSGSTKAGDAKKPTEWVLEDWAVRNGVESTTKYRGKNASRRSVRPRAHHPYDHRLPQHHSPLAAKGASVRKGDMATNKMGMRGYQYTHATSMAPRSHHINMIAHPQRATTMPSMYQSPQRQSYEDMMMPQIERMTQPVVKQEYSPMTPDSSGFGFMLPESSLVHAHAGSSSASNSNGTTAYALPSGTPNMYVGTSPCEYPYGMVDVTGVYQGSGHNGAAVAPNASGGVNERLMGIGPNAVYSWNGQAL
ncbi:Forkhead box protein O4 [Fusarium austroafricanum]|uniref:Forkhead box protein O n=1 Tax=Fusarium austroafricanum TaxID=2364996 RepID=A0A8H4JWD6_9HYPO|nr:Forkhead box protein O4 [Fusarium austroafricanum]